MLHALVDLLHNCVPSSLLSLLHGGLHCTNSTGLRCCASLAWRKRCAPHLPATLRSCEKQQHPCMQPCVRTVQPVCLVIYQQ